MVIDEHQSLAAEMGFKVRPLLIAFRARPGPTQPATGKGQRLSRAFQLLAAASSSPSPLLHPTRRPVCRPTPSPLPRPVAEGSSGAQQMQWRTRRPPIPLAPPPPGPPQPPLSSPSPSPAPPSALVSGSTPRPLPAFFRHRPSRSCSRRYSSPIFFFFFLVIASMV
jgi:hypothetical protein